MDDGLHDWEFLHGSDTESSDSIISEKKSGSSSVIDDGMVVSDHFSADNLLNKPTYFSQYGSDCDSSRVDYGSGSPNPGVVGVNLGLDQFQVNQSDDVSVRNDLGIDDSKTGILSGCEVRLSDFEAANEKDLESGAAAELTGGTISPYISDDLQLADGRYVENQSGIEEPIEDSRRSWSDSGGNELVSGDSGIVNGEDEIVSDSGAVSTEVSEGNGGNIVEVGAVGSGDEGKSRETVWWKMPFVILKYSVFKIGPVWSVSMAAAVMGLVLLGRRLYNMKKKAQRFHLKVTINDKKVSGVMSQAARLNEVFTEVRRVPVIRPALTPPGAWPVLSLR